jgi:diguanylate cyclase (GGDEF)-like protein
MVDLSRRIDECGDRDGTLCVIALEIDDVATIREVHGHATADAVVESISDRICVGTRGTDLVSRVDDGEYFVVLTAISSPGDADFVAAKICHQLGEPITAGGHQVHVTAHTGIAVARSGSSGADLIAHARRDAERAPAGARASS